MNFSTNEDVEIPIEDVFDMLTEFDAFERMFLRRGIEVVRTSPEDLRGEGMQWRAKGTFRGKPRVVDITLARMERPSALRYDGQSEGLESGFLVELMALSRRRTRMRVALDLKPRTLTARLMIQSAKIARNTLVKRYKARVAQFAEDMEARHKKGMRV